MAKRSTPYPDPASADRQWRAFNSICAVLNPFAGAQGLTPQDSAATDWAEVGKFADFHGIRPALQRALSAMPAANHAMAELQTRLADFQRGHRFRVMQTTAQIVDLARAFEAAGIVALFFKGAMLGEQIYGGAQFREFNDVDILVRPSQRCAAEGVLAALDFQPIIQDPRFRAAFFGYLRQHNFRHQASRTTVDLHWGFVGHGPFPITLDQALDSAAQLELAGTTIAVPAAAAQALILAGHGHKEDWAAFGWVLDFTTFAARNPALRWDRIAAAARRQNCLEPLLGAVLLVQRLFDHTVDQALARLAAERSTVTSNVDRIIVNLATLQQRSFEADLMGGFNLCETPVQRAAMALRLMTTPTVGDYEAMPLAPRWWWLYRLTRPMRLLARAVQGRKPTQSALWDQANAPRT